jgi:hypothetical protein
MGVLITKFNLSGYLPSLCQKSGDYILFDTESKEKGGTGKIILQPHSCALAVFIVVPRNSVIYRLHFEFMANTTMAVYSTLRRQFYGTV